MNLIKSFSLENFLFKILIDVSSSSKRSAISDIVSSGCGKYLVDLAVANNVDQCLAAIISQLSPELQDNFPFPIDCGGIQGFRNAETFRLHHESKVILSNFSFSQHKIVLVKGYSISCYYPSTFFRQQNDIDIAVGSFSDLVELYKIMKTFSYIPRVLAIRLNERSELEGSLSMVRVDESLKETFWCDIWIGVQPISLTEARQLDESFWKETIINSNNIRVPNPSESLIILLNEIQERNSLRYRDVFDFLSILENGLSPDNNSLGIDISQHKNTIKGIFNIANRNRQIIANTFLKWQEFSFWKHYMDNLDLKIELPIQVNNFEGIQTIENLGLEQAINVGVFTRFLACAGDSGDFAIARLNSKLILRTPIGCFISESSI
ncbi:hypothetical protein [Nostoc sp. FACHB-190]|uniref:hypothetical protein n=1 Tax=Nostoc sp. FACHB-190 TaxID=2692838 RepID=UPI001682FA52|nr:hypothetical protein [Nostoc sp. FACHB-190]